MKYYAAILYGTTIYLLRNPREELKVEDIEEIKKLVEEFLAEFKEQPPIPPDLFCI